MEIVLAVPDVRVSVSDTPVTTLGAFAALHTFPKTFTVRLTTLLLADRTTPVTAGSPALMKPAGTPQFFVTLSVVENDDVQVAVAVPPVSV